MADSSPLNPLKEALRSLVEWLDSENVQGLVIGGVAVSLLGRPRTTRDVDAVIWLADSRLDGFFQAARNHGFETRIKDPLTFARASRVLLMHHTASAIDVDVALGALPFEKAAIDRGRKLVLDDLVLPLPRSEDLIVMKAVAHRPRDAADVEGLLQARGNIDRQYVRKIVAEFAQALETPELLSDLESLFSRVPPDEDLPRDR